MSNRELEVISRQLQGIVATVERLKADKAKSAVEESSPIARKPSLDDEFPRVYAVAPARAGVDGLDAAGILDNALDDRLELKEGAGLFNLAMLLLGAAFGYLVLRNVRERGFQPRIEDFTCPEAQRDLQSLGLLFLHGYLMSLGSHVLTKLFLGSWISASVLFSVLLALCLELVGVPVYIAYTTPIAPLMSAIAVATGAMLALKAHSYAMTNYLLWKEAQAGVGEEEEAGEEEEGKGRGSRRVRKRTRKKVSSTALARAKKGSGSDGHTGEEADDEASAASGVGDHPRPTTLPPPPSQLRRRKAAQQSLASLSVLHFLYFLAAPVLAYEAKFERTASIRPLYLLRLFVGLLSCLGMQYFLLRQFMLPPLLREAENPETVTFLETFIRVAIPAFLFFLFFFSAFFHFFLNLVAELTRFADRRFFSSFWDATTIRSFWRSWNSSTFVWTVRYLYTDSQRFAGVSKSVAMLLTFAFSAAIHELISSAAFKTVRGWWLLAMLAQVPLIAISEHLKGTRRGNLLVWFSLFIGQPLLLVLYMREWIAQKKDFFCVKEEA